MPMPIDPSFAISGAEWRMPASNAPTGPSESNGFGGMLASSVAKLEKTQVDAAQASRDIATGASTDSTSAIMAVERARLTMQMASQLRTKGVEAMQTIYQTQV